MAGTSQLGLSSLIGVGLPMTTDAESAFLRRRETGMLFTNLSPGLSVVRGRGFSDSDGWRLFPGVKACSLRRPKGRASRNGVNEPHDPPGSSTVRLVKSPLSAFRAVTVGSRARYVVAICVFIGAGALFASSAITSRGTNLRSDQISNLSDLVRQSSQRLARTQRRVDVQRKTVERLGLAADAPGLAQAEAAVVHLTPTVGGVALVGPAIRVTLDDAPPQARTNPDIDPNDLVVHQQDVQAVVNAIWRAGARGVMVMDQRIVATSAIKCVGNTLLIQGRVYSPPYTITGIGNEATMLLSLQNDPDVTVYRDYADAFGLGWQVDRFGTLTMPAFSIPARLSWAHPVAAPMKKANNG